jgi:hypothetical protein
MCASVMLTLHTVTSNCHIRIRPACHDDTQQFQADTTNMWVPALRPWQLFTSQHHLALDDDDDDEHHLASMLA